MTRSVESEIANHVTMILHPDGADERALEWDHDGSFTASDMRTILAAVRGDDPGDVDATKRECRLALGEWCGFETGPGSKTTLTKRDKQAVLGTIQDRWLEVRE